LTFLNYKITKIKNENKINQTHGASHGWWMWNTKFGIEDLYSQIA